MGRRPEVVHLRRRRGRGSQPSSPTGGKSMVAFSARLDETLRRAVTIANERRHEQVMLDHLLALTDDEDAAAVMRGCHVDIEKLRGRLGCSLADLPTRATADGEVKPKATLALR